MPITITLPHSGGIFGPGLQIDASTDFEWSAFPEYRWWIGVISEDGQFVVERMAFARDAHFYYHFLSNNRASGITETTTAPWPANGTAVQLVLSITDGGLVAQEQRQQIVWDTTAGLGVQQYLQSTTTTGGFTQQDRDALLQVQAGMTVDLTSLPVPTDLTSVPIGNMPGQPPMVWSERVGPFNLVGRGKLTPGSSGVRGTWTGLRWFYEAVPPGWGMKPGAIDIFDNRPAQLVPIIRLLNGEEIGQPILNTDSSGGFQDLWGVWWSGDVAYDVAPGFTVSLFLYRLIGSG